MHTIQTYTGIDFDIQNPKFHIHDIAHALSMNCRFNGHIKWFYSVADHSIMVSNLMNGSLEGLMHDAAEAYLSDVPSPIKQLLPDWKKLEDNVESRMRLEWGLPKYPTRLCKAADKVVLLVEALQLIDYKVLEATWSEEYLNGWEMQVAKRLIESEGNKYKILEPSIPHLSKMNFLFQHAKLTHGTIYDRRNVQPPEVHGGVRIDA